MKPILNRPTAHATSTQSTQPTFGQARAEQMQQRLASSLAERRKLAAVQSAAQQANNQPMQHAVGVRERLVEQRIDRLNSEIADISDKSDN